MKEIPLSQCKIAFVNDEDYDYLRQWKWYALKNKNTFYAIRRSRKAEGFPFGRAIYMHRVILGHFALGCQTDHIDGNGLNNQRDNIRNVTHRQNCQNIHSIKGIVLTSKYPGVYWHKLRSKWQAQIEISGIKKYLGIFFDEEVAANAYKQALHKIGEVLINKKG